MVSLRVSVFQMLIMLHISNLDFVFNEYKWLAVPVYDGYLTRNYFLMVKLCSFQENFTIYGDMSVFCLFNWVFHITSEILL